MNTFFLAFIILVAIIFVLRFLSSSKGEKEEIATFPFYEKKPLTPVEQSLYYKLEKALPEYVILSQVSLSRFIGVKEGANYMEWLNKINRMTVDFLVCKKDFSIVAAVELDDSSHNSERRQEADDKKNKALQSAGIRIIRWNVKNVPDTNKIREEIIQTDPKI